MLFTAFVTLASLLLYASTGVAVAKARERYNIKAPATTGDPAFERVYRVQMNTLEWLALYLPCLWLFAFYVSDPGAAALGVVWIFGRFLYRKGYEEAAEKRTPGFVIQATSTSILFLGVLLAVLYRLATGH